ncbi:L,D-transpeptidase, partial [Mesorhizobium sp. M4B.F.Ca.ET.049.02.1.2]
MVLSRRGVVTGGLALVAVGATGNTVRAAAAKS